MRSTPHTPIENKTKELPSQKVLLDLLNYDEKSGKLIWAVRPRKYSKSDMAHTLWNGRWAGTPALNYPRSSGHLVGNIFDSSYAAHRVIWKLKTGEDPLAQIDHINGTPEDNSWSNLRKANRSQNYWNAKVKSCNTSGRKGVHFDKARGKWVARLTHYRIILFLGRFDTFEDACAARSEAERQHHKEFALQ